MKISSAAVVALITASSLALGACAASNAETAAESAAPAAAPAAQVTAVAPQATAGAGGGLLQGGDIVFGVSATGQVVAQQDADLVFQVNGRVGEVLVEEGDEVKKDDLLAVLDVRSFDQDVRNAEAGLVSARADLAALTEDPTNERARAAEAAVGQAQGQLAQVQGSVTQEDIAAAQASVQEAEAALADLLAGPKNEEVRQANAQLAAAQAGLVQSRNSLSQAKTQAEIALQQATTALQTAQVQYSEAYWDWKYVQDNGREPSDIEQGGNPELSDQGTQAIYNRFKQAELQLQQAEQSLASAEKQLEQAQQAEIDGIAAAQANVDAAQASLDLLVRPADQDDVAQAQARLANARANLQKLQGQQRSGQLEAAAASVAAAQAQLDELYNDPTASEQTRAEAAVARAEAQLEQARLSREYAEIRAPFAGEIAIVNIDPGDPGTTGGANGEPAIRIVDTSQLYVEVQVSDADIARVKVGQKATLTADALPGETYNGTVSFVSPTATSVQNVTTYLVKIQLDDTDTPLRVGMSVTADLETDQ